MENSRVKVAGIPWGMSKFQANTKKKWEILVEDHNKIDCKSCWSTLKIFISSTRGFNILWKSLLFYNKINSN